MSWSGTVFRCHHIDSPPTSAEWSRRIGGRWNVGEINISAEIPTAFAALYTSLDRDTAVAEVLRHLGAGPHTQEALRLRRVTQLEVSLYSVLDWRDGVNPDLPREALIASDLQPTRVLASAAYRLGVQGLLVPSAASEGINLVIFPDYLRDLFALIQSARTV